MRFQPAVAPVRHPILGSQSLANGFPDLSKHSIAALDLEFRLSRSKSALAQRPANVHTPTAT
ncbi:hypothetical protein, partial [Microcoleus sp. S28C3]|uniref:hypothetical protein n=1 Tax=Microcoleus sp. S28C3 TaxID=3055414 RepID=UPI002FD2736B